MTTSAKCTVAKRNQPFRTQLYDYDVLEGENAIFEVKVEDPSYEVEWFLGKDKIYPAGRFHLIAIGSKRRLLIENVKLEDGESGKVGVKCQGKFSRAKLVVEKKPVAKGCVMM